MSVFLLDVNVLVALLWPAHSSYARAHSWLIENSRQGWATCPLTQAAAVRIISNPAFSPDALTPQEALKFVSANLKYPTHRFWFDEITYEQAVQPFASSVTGHQQVTDAYLLGLAIHKRGKFATLDHSIAALLPDKGLRRDHLELI